MNIYSIVGFTKLLVDFVYVSTLLWDNLSSILGALESDVGISIFLQGPLVLQFLLEQFSQKGASQLQQG